MITIKLETELSLDQIQKLKSFRHLAGKYDDKPGQKKKDFSLQDRANHAENLEQALKFMIQIFDLDEFLKD